MAFTACRIVNYCTVGMCRPECWEDSPDSLLYPEIKTANIGVPVFFTFPTEPQMKKIIMVNRVNQKTIHIPHQIQRSNKMPLIREGEPNWHVGHTRAVYT